MKSSKVTAKKKDSGKVLPFPTIPSASKTGETLAESTMKRRQQPDHLSKDAPNVLIILMDDVGFGQCGTFGGEVNTPTISKLWNEGIAYNKELTYKEVMK